MGVCHKGHTRICRQCGETFVITMGNQRFCNAVCKTAFAEGLKVARRVQQPRASKVPAADRERETALSEIRYVVSMALDLGDSGPCVSLRGTPGYDDLVRQYDRRAA